MTEPNWKHQPPPRYDAPMECPDCGGPMGEDDETCGACRKRRSEEYEAMQWGDDDDAA